MSTSNLRLAQAELARSTTNAAYIELRGEVTDFRKEMTVVAERLGDAMAALRSGRIVDAHEYLTDIRADLRACLSERP